MPPITTGPAGITVALTRREAQVLRLAADGLTDDQIARRLAITRRTASQHMFNLRHRLGAANRTHAVALAAAHGLITLATSPSARTAEP